MTDNHSYSYVTWVFEGQPSAVQVESVVSVPIIEVVYLYETLLLHESGSPMYEYREEIQIIVGQEDVVVGYEDKTVLIDSWSDGLVWPGAYRDVLRLYGWHVVAVSLASGWMTGGLDCRWRTDDLEAPWLAAMPMDFWAVESLTDHWHAGALSTSTGGTP